MGVNSLPKTVIRQCNGCDLNLGPSAPESSTVTTRLQSHSTGINQTKIFTSSTVFYTEAALKANKKASNKVICTHTPMVLPSVHMYCTYT